VVSGQGTAGFGSQGVFTQDEVGFGRVTDSPVEAVDLIVRSPPSAVKASLKPVG
jgi:hypothetical protein